MTNDISVLSGGWPDEARLGVPLNPGVDGWHWLIESRQSCDPAFPILWVVRYQIWKGPRIPAEMATSHNYLGPCLTPAQQAVEIQAAKREVLADIRDEAAHLRADARDGVRNGSKPGDYENAADWIEWVAEKVERNLPFQSPGKTEA